MNDHRKLGRELGLFGTDPLMGSGLPFWLPDGAIVRHELEEYIRDAECRAGYQHVYSPVLGKRELYEISGHWSLYSEDMFPPMDVGGEQVVLRPSLCPHHALIYGLRAHVKSPDQGSLAARIRASRIVPYQAVIGPREAAEDKVALRLRDGRRFDAQPADAILRRIADRIRIRGADLWDAPN